MDSRASRRSLSYCCCNMIAVVVAVVLAISLSYPLSATADEGLSDRQLLQQANFSDIWRVFPSQKSYLKGVKNPCWVRRKGIDGDFGDRERALEAGDADSQKEGRGSQEEEEEGEIICLPSFYILGPQKTGTTDLYKRILRHPQVLSAKRKEIHWWTERMPRSYDSGLADYIPFFEKEAKNVALCKKFQAGSVEYNASCQTVTGEASATTMYLHRGWLRERHKEWPLPRVMAALQPSAKLIAFLREPGARLLSEHKFFYHLSAQGTQTAPQPRCRKMGFEEPPSPTPEYFHKVAESAVEKFQRCIQEKSESTCMYDPEFAEVGTYVCPSGRIAIGLYALYLELWLKYFPRENLLILRLEDFARQPDAFIDRIFRFIGVETTASLQEDRNHKILRKGYANSQKSNTSPSSWMIPETRALLTEFYSPYNQRLALLLNNSDFLWADEIGTSVTA